MHLLSALRASRDGFEITDTSFSAVLFSNTRHRNASRTAFRHNFLELCKSSGMLREENELTIQVRAAWFIFSKHVSKRISDSDLFPCNVFLCVTIHPLRCCFPLFHDNMRNEQEAALMYPIVFIQFDWIRNTLSSRSFFQFDWIRNTLSSSRSETRSWASLCRRSRRRWRRTGQSA